MAAAEDCAGDLAQIGTAGVLDTECVWLPDSNFALNRLRKREFKSSDVLRSTGSESCIELWSPDLSTTIPAE